MIFRKESAEPGEHLAQVVAGAAQEGIHGVAVRPFQEVASQPAVGLHMTDDWLNCIAPPQPFSDQCRHTASGTSDPYLQLVNRCPR
jgi:hypothetical protein